MHVDHAARRLARRRAVEDLELLALVTRPPGDRKRLLELLTRRAAERVHRVHRLGRWRRAERFGKPLGDRLATAGAGKANQQGHSLLPGEMQGPPKRPPAVDCETVRDDRRPEAREPVTVLRRKFE